MEQFFISPGQINGHEIEITGQDVNHIKNVLRKRVGDEIALSDGSKKEYRCRIEEILSDKIVCSLEFIKENDTELNVRVHLYQGLPKGDKLETVIQKCVELGVYDITPVICKRTIVKLDSNKADKKIARLNAISEAAAKQSKRHIIPQIKPYMSFKEAIEASKNDNVKLIPYELSEQGMKKTREIISSLKEDTDIAVFIGPEGGFDDSEIELAHSAGFDDITLGRRILRTETAGMCFMSWIVLNMD